MQRKRDGLLDVDVHPRLDEGGGRGARETRVHGGPLLNLVSVFVAVLSVFFFGKVGSCFVFSRRDSVLVFGRHV